MHNSILVQLITISIRLMRAGCSIRVFCTEQLITTCMLVHIERFHEKLWQARLLADDLRLQY